MSIPETNAIVLFQQLENAIAGGKHKRAAIIARKLALFRTKYSVDQIRNEIDNYEQPITVNLYVEDKSFHQGPFPLQIYPTMTLGMLKHKLEKEFSFPKQIQRWILNKKLATDENSTLYEFNVRETGCPLFLYLIDSGTNNNNVSLESVSINNQYTHKNGNCHQISIHKEKCAKSIEYSPVITNESAVNSLEIENQNEAVKNEDDNSNYDDSVTLMEKRYIDEEAEKNYQLLVQLDNQELIPNNVSFECPVCFTEVQVAEGVILRECLHQFCKECLANAVEYTENAVMKCLFRNDHYTCESQLQEREIKALVSQEVYERYLHRGMTTAECRTENSFHCKTPDCPGWCVYENAINTFSCPVCFSVNCLTCQAIHEGLNCRQYQDELQYQNERNMEDKETQDYLENMVKEGKAMHCPKCDVIVMKKWGCDWLKCSVCETEICWITKKPRWGPQGHGDTTDGCKCGVNGVRCHPQCNYCH